MIVRIQTKDFDVAHEIEALRARCNGVGAVASFIGLVRDTTCADGVSTLMLEHYPAMTEKALRAIVAEATRRWRLIDVAVIHRVGALDPADQIVLVLVAGAHRREAFRACEFVVDALKTRAPFWKKETRGTQARWVSARESDNVAVLRWAESVASPIERGRE
jgi:molybdopterin synthase catalytic subunit